MVALTTTAMAIYFLAPPLMAFNTIVSTLFQSTEKPGKATVISLVRGFVLVIVGLLVLPKLFPENGVWGSLLFAEGATAMISVVWFVRYLIEHQKKREVFDTESVSETL